MNDATVIVTDECVTVKRTGKSSIAVANVLGTTQEGTKKSIFLDRLVHAAHEKELGEYQVIGAVSSILTIQTAQ